MKSAKKLARFLKPYWKWVILAPALMILEVMMDLMQPKLIQQIIDVGIAQLDMTVIINTSLLMLGLAFIGAIGGFGCTVFATKTAQAFGGDLRQALFAKVQSLSFGNLDELETGQLITRLTNDVTQVQQVVGMLLRIMVRAPLMLLGSLVMAILTSPRLALLFFVLIPAVLGLLVLIIRKAVPMFTQVQKRIDDLNTVMQENLAGVRVIKAFVRGEHEIARFGNTNEQLMRQTIQVGKTIAIGMPAMMLVLNLGIAAVLWFGGIQVSSGTIQVGEIVAFVNYLSVTLMSLVMASMLIMMTARAQASAERIQEVLDSDPKIQNKPESDSEFVIQGRVAFENVTFSYDSDEHDPVLKNVSFVAEPGQTVAILGSTGAGKSSLIHLIPRFYDVSDGCVKIDGVDVRDVDKETLRQNIGIALQESVLFSGTIRDNICYGRPEATDKEVMEAARAAQAHDFVSTLPEGYHTQIGQRGVNLSGGQKQRIAIARALLVRPTILILDDSTSAVDVETEIKIQDALDQIMADRTSFVIAQRISTVLNAHKILVLDDGQIAAEGTHRELLTSSPIYREIYESQLGNGVKSYG
jgi:ATP-binding cassette subfamily B multidrug efflux pump